MSEGKAEVESELALAGLLGEVRATVRMAAIWWPSKAGGDYSVGWFPVEDWTVSYMRETFGSTLEDALQCVLDEDKLAKRSGASNPNPVPPTQGAEAE